MPPSRSSSTAFPNSPYAAELQRGVSERGFDNAALEADYLRMRLLGNRAIIRMACALAVLLTIVRAVQQTLVGPWSQSELVAVSLVSSISVALAAAAFGPRFERFYPPAARVLVPTRNAFAAVGIAAATAHGQLESLMVLPLMMLGPFFFLGLSFRTAVATVALTVATYLVSAAVFELPLLLVGRSCSLLLMAAAASGIAARHLERLARTSYLESRLIAELAQEDALTGLKNRRVFDEQLERCWRRAVDEARTIAILLIDVDNFKAYNDLYGHQAGDEALRRVGEALRTANSRPLDALARYGGEEFAAIAYDVEEGDAEMLGEQLRLAVSELGIAHRGSRQGQLVTISVGVAVIAPTCERRARGALQLADEALYQAKSCGRNRVEVMDRAAHASLVTGVFAQYSFANAR